MNWQPIETIPKDDTIVLVTDGKTYDFARYDRAWRDGYIFLYGDEYSEMIVDDLTHWMFLPELPNAT